MSHWWRAYNEAVDDPKLQRLPDALFKAWFNLMCLASRHGGVLPPIGDIAFSLRLSESKVAATLAGLENKGLLDRLPTGALQPHNWNARQYKSDSSTERVKLFRQRQSQQDGNVSSTVSVTPPEQSRAETDTDQKTEQTEVKGFVTIGKARANPSKGRRPPRHGATGKGMIWIMFATPEWEAYAEDFRTARGEDPQPDDRGGKWFKTLGEASGGH